MQTLKHLQFTILLKAGGQLHEFNFRRSLGLDGTLFTVDVADERGNRHYLMFNQEGNDWKLKTKNVPDWIEAVVPQIREAMDGLD